MPGRLEILPVDLEVGEHLGKQSLADLLFPIFDGRLAIAHVGRSV